MKILLSFFIYIFIFFVSINYIYANESFIVDLDSSYKINENGSTNVNYKYTIQNIKTESFAESLTLHLNNLNPSNITVSTEDGTLLNHELNKFENNQTLLIKLPVSFVGRGNVFSINVNFDDINLSHITGGALEINIPKNTYDNYNSFLLSIYVPKSFGKEAYIDPKPAYKDEDDNYFIYKYEKKDHYNKKIAAVFGVYQVYKYSLKFNIENKNILSKSIYLPVPPDTGYQRSYIQSINPKPVNIESDKDENWIAEFILKPFSKEIVKIEGNIKVFPNPSFPSIQSPQNILANLASTQYWPSDNKSIIDTAKNLSSTENIYKYVIDTLTYDNTKIGEENKRLGAIHALSQPSKSICTEYSDLFITLSRSAGIPAREIQGYAYSDNPQIQPLSLVSDILHSWPQYWDIQKNNWISVDPTWEDTSGNNYFNSFDMKHIAFVIHGTDDTNPLPPGNYRFTNDIQKDVYVTLQENDLVQVSDFKLSYNKKFSFNPFKKIFDVIFTNNGSSSVSINYSIDSEIDDFDTEGQIENLLPFSKKIIPIEVNYLFFGGNIPDNIKIIALPYELNINTQKNDILIIQIAFFLILAITLVSLTLLFTRKRN